MPILTAHVVNGTFVVPADSPGWYTVEQLDKLAAGAWVLSTPSIVGGLVLLIAGHQSFRQWYSFSRLAVLWMWSVAFVGIGIFSQYGHFSHFIDYAAILHIQTEWLIIALLLSASATQAYILASLWGFLLYLFLFALPGIKGTFFFTSVIGGFGDVFIPILLFYGRQYALGLGGVGHFLNAYVTFHAFVQYTSPSVYLSLQLAAVTLHSIGTVAGVLSSTLSTSTSAQLRLEDTEDEAANINPLAAKVLTKGTLVKLALLALVLDLAASLPINLAPRH